MANEVNEKVNQVEETTTETTQETPVTTTDNTLVVPTTDEKKPSKVGKGLKIAGAVAGALGTVAGAFLLGKFIGGKGSGSGS